MKKRSLKIKNPPKFSFELNRTNCVSKQTNKFMNSSHMNHFNI